MVVLIRYTRRVYSRSEVKIIAILEFFCYKTALVFHIRLFCLTKAPNFTKTNYYIETIWSNRMSRVCQVTGKRPMTGNNVSHANNKTKRRFLPNIQNHKFWVEEENRFVSLKLSTKGMRIIDKLGIKAVLDKIRANGEKV